MLESSTVRSFSRARREKSTSLVTRHLLLQCLRGEVVNDQEMITLAPEVLSQAMRTSSLSPVMELYLEDSPDGKAFLDSINLEGRVEIPRLADECGFSENTTLNLIELALAKGKIDGFFTEDKQTLITKTALHQEIERHLLAPV